MHREGLRDQPSGEAQARAAQSPASPEDKASDRNAGGSSDRPEGPQGTDGGVDAAQIDSLVGELKALVEDGKTYAEAEMGFQKTRLALAAQSGKSAGLFVLIGLALAHLALVALVVGVLIALVPTLGAWAAIAIVVGALLGVGALFLLAARRKATQLTRLFDRSDP